MASAALLIWLATLVFIFGPARWEYAHTYKHRIESLGSSLPILTEEVGLSLLGLGRTGVLSTFVVVLVWGVTWIGPLILLLGTWRVHSREALSDLLLFGSLLYGSFLALFLTVTAVSLWLPFSLL